MKQRFICLLILCLFMLSNTAFATNWVFVYKDEEASTFIDTDTVVRNGDNVVFWGLRILNTALDNGTKKVIRKQEAVTSISRQDRQLESYGYDSNDREIWHYTTPSKFRVAAPGWGEDQEIVFALQYAKPSEDTGSIPRP